MDDYLTSEDATDEGEEENYTTGTCNIARFALERRLSTSPSERLWSQTLSPTSERRMYKNIYKGGKRCFIENTNDGALHYVHCLSRRLDPRRINDLEFAWVSAKLKAFWEDDKFILVPEDHILERYIAAKKIFPDIGEGPYKYRLLAHPDMKTVAFHRQIVFPEDKAESPKAEHFVFSAFPFKNLGTLTSHIHPRFAICHIVARPLASANDILDYYGLVDQATRELIGQCMRVISIWSPYGKDVASNDTRFINSQITADDVYSETSDRTANCRLLPHMSDERLIEEQDFVYVKEEDGIVRLKHKEDAPHLLTAKKLRIFEEQTLVHQTTENQWEVIQSWRSDVSDKPEEQDLIHVLPSEDIFE